MKLFNRGYLKQALTKNNKLTLQLGLEEVNPTMDNHEPGSFQGLPDELLLTVIEHCDTQGLAALSGVAMRYNNICRTIIFRKVDLSIHNRGKVLCTFPNAYQYIPSKWYEPSDSLQCNTIPPNIQKRQEAFLSALIRNPSLAEHVRTFSWTLLLLDSNRRTHLSVDPFAIDKNVALGPNSPFNKIWDVFACLNNVRTLDLAWLTRHLAMPLIQGIPSTMFPAATSVRLVGVMPYALATSILLANPQNILHLDLDNLQQSGIIPRSHIDKDLETDDERCKTKYAYSDIRTGFSLFDGYPNDTDALDESLDGLAMKSVYRIRARPASPIPILDPTLIPPHRQTRQSWNNFAHFSNESEYFNAPGPMQNLLGASAGKFTSLTSLHLRKNDVYTEWGIFLASVRPTLETLTFEQGERLLPKVDWVQPPVRPMDQLFGDRIFPILTEAGAGQWPRMKKVVIRGVQQWEDDHGQGTGEMVLVDGKGVEVVIKREAREADHMG
ncbi:MAG: hypothetical protein Q9175_006961, partial [Cornicularia normoerica]